QYSDKHARLHEVYCVANGPRGSTRREGPATGYTQTMPVISGQVLDAAQVAEVEADLTRLIGPLSRVLVRKALPLARSIPELREALAPSIQEERSRDAFIYGTLTHSQSHPGHSRPASQPPSSRPMPLSQPLSRSGSRPSRPMPQSQPVSSRLEPTRRTPSRPEPSLPLHSTRQMDIPPEELAIIEHTLSKFIGPMAKMLIRKEASRATTFKEFVMAVAANIDHVQQREVFLQAIKRALPQR
ncbi:MAG: hypothetical protein AB7O72_05440, partial [Ramlibacter sp.]